MMVDADLDLLDGQAARHLRDRHGRVAGGVGAARLLAGLVQVVDPADDHRRRQRRRRRRAARAAHQPRPRHRHLHAGRRDRTPRRGWGLAGETWQAMDAARAATAGSTWFSLGDRDLGTHLYRTERLRRGRHASPRSPPRSPPAWGLGLRLAARDRRPAADHGHRRRTRARSASRSTSCSATTTCRSPACASTAPTTARPGPRRARRPRRRRRGGHRPVEPDRVDRPGAGRARRAGGGRGPARRRRGRLPHHRRGRAQGPGRPAADRAGPRGLGGRRGPPLRPAGGHARDRRGRRRPRRRPSRPRACAAWWPRRSCAARPRRPAAGAAVVLADEPTRAVRRRGHPRGPRRATTWPGCIAAAAAEAPRDGDVVVVTQKVVSKAEDQLVADRPRRPPGAQGRSSRRSRCGSCAAAATWSSARPSTASCAPTPASTCPTSTTG